MWLVYAVLASLFWGLSYVFNEQILKHVSVPTVIAIDAAFVALAALCIAIFSGVVREDVASILASQRLLWLVACGIIAAVAANFFISYSIVGKDATSAGIVEISYPLFIALFSYLLFRESELSLVTALGGAFIFAGAAILIAWGR